MPLGLLILIYFLVSILGAFISKAFFREIKPEIPEELNVLTRILLKLGYLDFLAWGVIGLWMLHFLQANYFPHLFVFVPLNALALFLTFLFGFFASTVFGRFWQFYASPARLVNKLEIISFKCFPTEPYIDRATGEPTYADLKIKVRQTGRFWVPGGIYGVRIKQDDKKIIGIMAGNDSLNYNGETEITVPWAIEPCGKENWQTTLAAYVVGNPNTTPVASSVPPKNITVKIKETEDPLALIKIEDIKFYEGEKIAEKISVGKNITVKIIVTVDQDYFNLSEEARAEVYLELLLDSNPLQYFKFAPVKGEALMEVSYEWTPTEVRLYSFSATARYGQARLQPIVRGVYVEKMEVAIQVKDIEMQPLVTTDKPVLAGEIIHFYATIKNQSPQALADGQVKIFLRFDGPHRLALDYDGPTGLDKGEEKKFGPIAWVSEAGSDWIVKADASATDAAVHYPSEEQRTVRFKVLSGEKPKPKISCKTAIIKSEEIELDASGTIYTEGAEWKWEHYWKVDDQEYEGKIVKHRFNKEGIINVHLTVRGTYNEYTVESSTAQQVFVFTPPLVINTLANGSITEIAGAKQSLDFEVKLDQDYIKQLKEKFAGLGLPFNLAEIFDLEQKISGCQWKLGTEKASLNGKKISFTMPDENLWFPCEVEVSFAGATEKSHAESGVQIFRPVAVISYERDAQTAGKIKFSAAESRDASGAKITSWRWDFGDGQTGEGESLEHRFTGEKRFCTVKLFIKSQYGAEAKDEEEVEIELPIEFEFQEVGLITGETTQLVKNIEWKQEYRVCLRLKNTSPTTITNIGCSLLEIDDEGKRREVLFEPSDDTVANGEETFLISETLKKDWVWYKPGNFIFNTIKSKLNRTFTYSLRVWGETERQRKENKRQFSTAIKISDYRIKAACVASAALGEAKVAEAVQTALTIAAAFVPNDIAKGALTVAKEVVRMDIVLKNYISSIAIMEAKE